MESQFSPEFTPAAVFVPPPKVPWYSWRRLGYNFMTISLLVHVLLGIGAAYFVVSVTYPKKKSFAGGAPTQSTSKHAVEHKVSMAKAQQRSSAPVSAKRVTTTGASKVALPTMPAMPLDGAVVPVSMSGMGGGGLGSFGSGGGGTGGGVGGNGPSFFGLRAANNGALVGSFYDLKQTKEGQPTADMNVDQDKPGPPGPTGVPGPSAAHIAFGKFVGQFVKNGIFENNLNRYFKGPSPLYNKMFYIPRINANDGPKAFNLEKLVQPKRWIAFYHGQVIAPETGRFRFVGIGDDVLAVRFNGQVVLDADLANHSGLQLKQEKYKYADFKTVLQVGTTINVSAGAKYPLDVAIGEDPGGVFYTFLMLEKIGETYEQNGGSPVLPVFKVGAAETPKVESNPNDYQGPRVPPTAPDKPWSVWKAAPATATTF